LKELIEFVLDSVGFVGLLFLVMSGVALAYETWDLLLFCGPAGLVGVLICLSGGKLLDGWDGRKDK